MDSEGQVTAVALGTATITATTVDGGLTATCEVTVTNNIVFADSAVKTICVANWDTDNDGELSYDEAASVSSLSSSLFQNNTEITSFAELQYFTGIVSIDWSSFSGCTNLTSITIPNGVTTIGNYAFYGCNSLHEIIVPESIKVIGNKAFYGCSSLTNFSLPSQLETIGGEAFSGCSLIKEVSIPNSVTSLVGSDGYDRIGAFYGSSIEIIKCDISLLNPSGKLSLSKLGLAFTYTMQYSISGTNKDQVKSITITSPSVTNQIPTRSFEDFSGLETIVLPSAVTQIGSYAFKGCRSLTEVPIQNTVEIIEDGAFYGCTGLSIVDLHEGLLSLGGEVFRDCSGLTSVVIPDGITRIEHGSFNNCRNLANISIPESVTFIGQEAFRCCSLTSLLLPNNLVTIEEGAFYGCVYLESVNVPTGITEIENNTFGFCCALQSLTLPQSLSTIGDGAFAGSGLNNIIIPESVTSIGSNAFGDSKPTILGYPFGTRSSSCQLLSEIVFTSATPCSLGSNTMTYPGDYPIFVPIGSLNIYKAANGWSQYAERLFPFISVTNQNSTSLSLSLDSGSMKLVPEEYTKSFTWESSNPEVASVDTKGCVIAVAIGNATITAISVDGNYIASCEVTVTPAAVPGAVELGLSVKWASFNLGASAPEEYGDYYAWGEVAPYYSNLSPLTWQDGKSAGYAWASYKWCNGSYNSLTKYNTNSSWGSVDNKTSLDPEDDAAHVVLGANWRMPTDAEWSELRENCTWTWTTINGVFGSKVTSNKTGYTDKWIFLPATNDLGGSTITHGYYWSSSLRTDLPSYSWDYTVTRVSYGRNTNLRGKGLSIRPVTD